MKKITSDGGGVCESLKIQTHTIDYQSFYRFTNSISENVKCAYLCDILSWAP